MAHTMHPRAMIGIDTSWLAALIVTIGLILMFAGIGLNGIAYPGTTGSVAHFDGHPEAIVQTVPAYIQESIVFGDLAPSDVIPSAEIMPVYLIESSYFGG